MSIKHKFHLGQRVSRPKDVYAKKWKLKFGTITKIYSKLNTQFGDYPELYEVKWDGSNTSKRGYLPHGIDAVQNNKGNSYELRSMGSCT